MAYEPIGRRSCTARVTHEATDDAPAVAREVLGAHGVDIVSDDAQLGHESIR
jgi:hypothetical protein